jgi:hypothetical protein
MDLQIHELTRFVKFEISAELPEDMTIPNNTWEKFKSDLLNIPGVHEIDYSHFWVSGYVGVTFRSGDIPGNRDIPTQIVYARGEVGKVLKKYLKPR